jgi:Plasmid pRiA4b ORF-3-like protein
LKPQVPAVAPEKRREHYQRSAAAAIIDQEVALQHFDFVLPMPTLLTFRVDLLGVKPPIWRKFELTGNPTFADLHQAIQDACGWYDSHLYMFTDSKNGHQLCEFVGHGEGSGAPQASSVRVSKYLRKPGDIVRYLYDFGDGWDHRVRLVDKSSTTEKWQRRLTGGARAFPPEDCGGLPGYQNCLAIRAGSPPLYPMDPEDLADRQEQLSEWQPESFDLAESKQHFDR